MPEKSLNGCGPQRETDPRPYSSTRARGPLEGPRRGQAKTRAAQPRATATPAPSRTNAAPAQPAPSPVAVELFSQLSGRRHRRGRGEPVMLRIPTRSSLRSHCQELSCFPSGRPILTGVVRRTTALRGLRRDLHHFPTPSRCSVETAIGSPVAVCPPMPVVTTLRRALDSTLKQALNTGDPTEQQGAQHQSEEF